jgi:outer membrane protein assembly factor BamB
VSIFTATRWAQLQADRLHHGFRAVHSRYALQPAWTVNVIGAPASSPVVAEDGTIYIGDTQGRLVAVNPDGGTNWMVTLPGGGILSTPAVAEDSNIYIISTTRRADRFRSTLHSVAPDGTLRWSSEFPTELSTSASPTTWGFEQHVYIFVYTGFWLLIYDELGTLLLQEKSTLCVTITGGTGILGDILDTLWEIITEGGVDFDTSGFLPPPIPTAAVVDSSNLTPPGQPIVVNVSRCGVLVRRWSPPSLTTMWSHSFDPDGYYFSSPAVTPFGTLVVGREDGRVLAYAVDTGERLWQYEAGESVFSTPASFGRQWFIVSSSHLHVIDFNGDPLHIFELPGPTLSSPALTGSLVYLQFEEGLHTFSFDLATYSVDGSGGRYAFTSPAAGPDGAIYVALGARGLRAYPGF